ncbi:MAG: ABC transporter substrate-binding protein [Acidilobus sp.]|jgi:ABC-type Fe3+-hydroxamate transport system substrate-binding protein
MVKLFSEILGKEVEVPEKPSRIVSLAPAITETLYMLGAEDRVVGVSFFCDKPPEVSKKPRVGAYLNVNYSLLQKLNPDLILVTTGAQRDRIAELETKGYTVYPIPLPVSIYGIIDNVIVTGILIGELQKARELAFSLAKQVLDLKDALTGVKLYYEIDLGGPVSVGAHSYIGDALDLLGASHPFSEARVPYIVNPDNSAIAKFDPDVIVYEQKLGENATPSKVRRRFAERGLDNLRAVKEGRIAILDYDSLAHYGPSFFSALKDLINKVKEALSPRQ